MAKPTVEHKKKEGILKEFLLERHSLDDLKKVKAAWQKLRTRCCVNKTKTVGKSESY
jgi:hypothetical protein